MAIFTVVLGPIVAQAADYWGRKWFLVGLSFSAALGSLVVALATSMGMVVGGCCLVGTVFGVQPLLQWVFAFSPQSRFPCSGASWCICYVKPTLFSFESKIEQSGLG